MESDAGSAGEVINGRVRKGFDHLIKGCLTGGPSREGINFNVEILVAWICIGQRKVRRTIEVAINADSFPAVREPVAVGVNIGAKASQSGNSVNICSSRPGRTNDLLKNVVKKFHSIEDKRAGRVAFGQFI